MDLTDQTEVDWLALSRDEEKSASKEVDKKSVKGRVYISDPSEAPDHADVREGPEGGYYYETGGEQGQDGQGGDDSSTSDEYGSMDDFDPSLAEQVTPIDEEVSGEPTGTAKNMEIMTMPDGSEVYKVDVDSSETEEALERTMVTYTILDAMGASTTDYTAAEDGSWFASQEAPGETLRDAPDEWKENIDRDEVVEVMAEQLVVGNWDAHFDNFCVDEDGSLTTFDYDNAGSDLSELNAGERNINTFFRTMQTTLPFLGAEDVSRDEVLDAAADKAQEFLLQTDPEVYEEQAPAYNEEVAQNITTNADMLARGEVQ